jgi:hypothetical protein
MSTRLPRGPGGLIGPFMSGAKRVSTILCAAAPRGSEQAVELLLSVARQRDADAVALVGDLGDGQDAYRTVFRALGRGGRPAHWVPGPGDAPLGPYLHQSQAIEAVHPAVRGVHGTAAYTSDGHVVVAGMGGELDDEDGSDAVAELVNTHRPRLAVCGGEPGAVTLVVAPGSLLDGNRAIADLHSQDVELVAA